jgi:hypothetical protein
MVVYYSDPDGIKGFGMGEKGGVKIRQEAGREVVGRPRKGRGYAG